MTETQHLHKKVLGFWGKVVGTELNFFFKVAYERSGEAARVSWEPRWWHVGEWGPGSRGSGKACRLAIAAVWPQEGCFFTDLGS